jgi:hypothetical protein
MEDNSWKPTMLSIERHGLSDLVNFKKSVHPANKDPKTPYVLSVFQCSKLDYIKHQMLFLTKLNFKEIEHWK